MSKLEPMRAAAVGLAACCVGWVGCVHEPPVTASPGARASMEETLTVEQLDDLLWPKTDDRWEPVTERELVALESLVVMLLERADAGYFGAAKLARAQRLLAETGLELRVVEVRLDPNGALEGESPSESLWVLSEPPGDRRGRGSYVFRVGELEPRRRGRIEHLLQAPHSRFDKYTGEIALGLFIERDIGVQPPRALFVNSTHRYRQFDGTRELLVPPERNPADAAHQADHPLARATALALRNRRLALIQLHGFERDLVNDDPEVIISSGALRPSEASEGVLGRLRAAFPNLQIAHYGVDAARLGAETNVQGQAARTARRCFVHVEMSESLRQQLRTDRAARRRLAAALFGADNQELRHGCQ
ncbi:hypothetical protein [Enhygromyxa salina]|uniref:Uncharacterized protein n=1 Tax=Enhygromyxa salina TaxID=215803 RepID=A0A2S9YRI4_9BACT|nr:hypothetical protein [Enhygromyxa salina]PRQ07696.1 hypothetical protein ENSA7_26860 [Enhygromyxa salina]